MHRGPFTLPTGLVWSQPATVSSCRILAACYFCRMGLCGSPRAITCTCRWRDRPSVSFSHKQDTWALRWLVSIRKIYILTGTCTFLRLDPSCWCTCMWCPWIGKNDRYCRVRHRKYPSDNHSHIHCCLEICLLCNGSILIHVRSMYTIDSSCPASTSTSFPSLCHRLLCLICTETVQSTCGRTLWPLLGLSLRGTRLLFRMYHPQLG